MRWLTAFCALALLAGGASSRAAQSPAVDAWGATSSGLRMGITPPSPGNEPLETRPFFVAIENVGDNDVVINLGWMLANGKVMFPEAVRLVVTDGQGTTQELRYFDRRYPGVAGRVDDFLVALRAGSVYVLRLTLDKYWPLTAREPRLPRGPCRMEARFTGNGATSLNGDTAGIALMNFWKGTLRSNAVEFQVP